MTVSYRDTAEIDFGRPCTCGHERGDHSRRNGLGACLDDDCSCTAFAPKPRVSCGPGRRDRGRPTHLEPLPGDPAGCAVVVRVLGYRRGAKRIRSNLYVEVQCVCGASVVGLLNAAVARKVCNGLHPARTTPDLEPPSIDKLIARETDQRDEGEGHGKTEATARH
jgi:hypothetical protein